jgi:tetratricopeptide (TPR) repeat protein
MKKYIPILFFLFAFVSGFTQKFAPKKFYLIDSLDLASLTKNDRQLIDSCLMLYHKAKEDTTKVNVINVIIEESWDENVWPKYNNWIYTFLQNKLKTNHSKQITYHLKISLAGALNNIGVVYNHQGEIPKTLEYYHKSLKIQEELGDNKGMAVSLNNIGYVYFNQGNIPKTLDYYHKSLIILNELGDKKEIATSLNNIGAVYVQQRDIPKSLEYYHKSLKISEEIGDKQGIGQSLNNIGVVYGDQKEPSIALEYYSKSLKLREEMGDKKGIAESLNNIGNIYDKLGNIPKAVENYSKSLKLREKLGNKQGIAESLSFLGNVFFNQGNIPKALEYYNKSLGLREEIDEKKGIAESLKSIGGIYLLQHNLVEAQHYAKKSLAIAQELGYPINIRNAANLLSQVYEKQASSSQTSLLRKSELGLEALSMHKLFVNMSDSINNEESKKASAQQQAKYEYEKQKAIDDAENEKLVAIEKEAKAKQKVITYATAGGLGLVAIFLIFVFNRLQVTKKQKLIIEQKERETHQQKELIEEKHREITDSINYAERIQRSFLATTEMLDHHLKDYFVFFRPKDIVSGDFYWAGELNDGNFAFSVADSTGHGVPGAIMSILNISSLEKSIEKETAPDQILNKTRKIIIERLKKDGSSEGGKDGMDCSLLVINKDRTQLSFAAANNPVFIVRPVRHSALDAESANEFAGQARNDGYELIEYKPNKMPVGKHDNDGESFTLNTTILQKGDVIYTLTDGFPDQFGGEKGKKYMIKNLKELLLQIAHLPVHVQEQKLADEFDKWKGENEQVDDVCIIGVRV